jgi:hypothetical protein
VVDFISLSNDAARARRRRWLWIPAEPPFLFGLAYLDESQTVIQLAGIWVVFLHAQVERDADRRGICLEVLDDGRADAAALDMGEQLNATQLDALGGASDPQSAGGFPSDLDDTGAAVGDLTPDLLQGPLTEALAPSPFVEVVRKAALSPRGLDDHICEESDVVGSGGPYRVGGHDGMISPLLISRLAGFW